MSLTESIESAIVAATAMIVHELAHPDNRALPFAKAYDNALNAVGAWASDDDDPLVAYIIDELASTTKFTDNIRSCLSDWWE